MQYIITFLEGLISFISPCMLPMLPVYISYFAGKSKETDKKEHIFWRAGAFVLGFTVVFTGLGLFAGTIGSFLTRYHNLINIASGIIVIIFGLSYLEVIHIPFFKGMNTQKQIGSIFSAFLFGMIYSVSLTPCVGAFLGSALMLASSSGGAAEGTMLLLIYSLGLGVPFIASALLIDRLNKVFTWIKKHYRIINIISGIFLIIVGILMCFGMLNVLMAMFI